METANEPSSPLTPRADNELARQVNEPAPGETAPPLRPWERAAVFLGRLATFAVLVPSRAGLRTWSRLRPVQQLVLSFALYALAGVLLLALPFAQARPTGTLDNFFNVVSAISTTGLTTVSLADSYTRFGELVVLLLFQGGGIGFMTLSSMFVLARGGSLSTQQLGVLKAGFAVPHYFVMQRFIVQVVVFTAICEAGGALILWWRFSGAGVESPLWSAVFHGISAFATAGFGLHNDSLERFAHDPIVNLTIGALSYLGAVGFIVAQDVWYSLKLRERMLTFTSKVILTMTAGVFLVGTLLLVLVEPSIRALPWHEALPAAAFQVMSASTTAGFNTIPIGAMSAPGLALLIVAMVIGASPSGTGGGIKTTSVSALLGNVASILRGRDKTVWMGHEVPNARVLYASAAATVYLIGLAVGLLLLTLTEDKPFLALVFEAASAIGTVGLSMGITGDLSAWGKLTLIALMFAGRAGPLTIGLALLRPEPPSGSLPRDDLAI